MGYNIFVRRWSITIRNSDEYQQAIHSFQFYNFTRNAILIYFFQLLYFLCLTTNIINTHIANMSDYDSSVDSDDNPLPPPQQKLPFRHDYYLTNSLDIFQNWKTSLQLNNNRPEPMEYLGKEFAEVRAVQKFRTAEIIRVRGFIHVLKQTFEGLQTELAALFASKKQQNIDIEEIHRRSGQLQAKLATLLVYLEQMVDLKMLDYYSQPNPENIQTHFASIIAKIYPYLTSVNLLWHVSCCQSQLTDERYHGISLGGNMAYYQNIVRSILKRNWQLKQVYDRLMVELKGQKYENMEKSMFLTKVIRQVLALQSTERLTQKEKMEFIDCLKGLYFLSIDLRGHSLLNQYLLASFHLDILCTHNMFTDYQELQDLFVRMLSNSRKDRSVVEHAFAIQIDKLPFEKRTKVPLIQELIVDITHNYIAVAKHLTNTDKIFHDIKAIPLSEAYTSSQHMLEMSNVNMLVGLMMCVQDHSKDAFSQGDLAVHKIYLHLSDLLKEIYLSYQHSHWLFPSSVLLYIPIAYLIENSQDLKADIKKVLFTMVETINQDKMPEKIVYNSQSKKYSSEAVKRAEYLQVILFFLEACRAHEEYINLPQIIPSNLQTSILYIKSLELKLNNKEPTPDQMPYVLNMLKTCEQYKLTINFKWFTSKESIEDRQIQFNIEKGLIQDWARKIYRNCINERESLQIKSHFEKYQKNQLTVINLANIFKYCHGLGPGKEIPKKSIRQEDLFTLLEEIKMLFSIRFDIFNLNLDEEISLNYIHVCLGLYNSCYDETPFNEAYMMIMENVMRPYLGHPGATATTFRSKYPGFFEKWLYSFQIGAIFHQLGTYIAEKGEDAACREDIINKIKYVSELIDNKQNITQTIRIEELTETIVIFSTLINRQAHPQVYIQCVQLFCLFLNSFPQVRKDVSIDFMVDQDLLSNSQLVGQIVKHVKTSYEHYLPDAISILNTIVEKIPEYMQAVGLKKINQIIGVYYSKNDNEFKPILSQLEDRLYKLKEEQPSFMLNILRLVLTLKKEVQTEKKGQKPQEIVGKIQLVKQAMATVKSKGQKEEFHLCELVFIQDVILRIDKKYEEGSEKKGNLLARELFHQIIKEYGTNEDRIYFAQKLDFYDLILTSNQGPIDQRQEAILTALIVESKYKGNETELIKKILRQSKKLSIVASNAIDILRKTPDKIQSHHLNKFIHINNRYPSEKIESFVIEHIGCERNHAPVKIKQPYLVKDLIKRLEKVAKNVCEELMLKPFRSEDEEKTIEFSSNIFEKLLYLPINKFQKVNLTAVEQIHEENEDWNTQSDPQEETKEEMKKESKEEEEMSEKDEEIMEIVNDLEENNESDNYDEDDRPQIIEMFIEQSGEKDMKIYEKYMLVRQQLDILLNSDYSQLPRLKEDKDIVIKVTECVNLLNNLSKSATDEIITRTPDELYLAMREKGLEAEITYEMREKMEKRKKIVQKPPKWRVQLFSDREESDDSNMVDEDDQDSDYYQEDDQDIQIDDEQPMSQSQSDSEEQYPQKKPKQKKSPSKQSSSKSKKFELPGLVPTYSKVQEEISGHELKRDQIIKILELSLYWLLKLPESQIRSKQITSYFMDILHSNLGQIFFESIMTVMRFEETQNNLEWFVRKIKDKESEKGRIQIGLQQVSMENAVNNVLYLIKEYQSQQDEREDKQQRGNILFKQSNILLPIAEHLLTKLDLPIQNNCLTLLFIHISTNKSKIRKKIEGLNYSLTGSELQEGKKQYKLKHSEMMRIIDSICRSGNSNTIWETIESMNLKLKVMPKLFGCLRGYGNHLYSKLLQTGEKIMKTIKVSEGEAGHMHNLENTYHIISKLVVAVKNKIKQFYFINKSNLKAIVEEQLDVDEQMENMKKIPKKLRQNKSKIFSNKQLIKLVEVVVYFIKILQDQFYGKIEDKLFNKLVQYPKMILEATWYYIFIFAKEEQYTWKTPSEIARFFESYPFIGSYKFGDLQEVFGVIVYFLNLQPFCTDKFKQFFLPILMKNPQLSKQITLRFKIPKIGDDDDYYSQTILVTRKCSFDMAFYQVTGHAIQVEFHEEEGSDHGGLVRELMIGWKGKGVGEEAFFIGKILGISFKQGVPYGGALDVGMFVAITNYKITLDFFKQFDPEIYRSLNYIQNNDPEPLCLKFVMERSINGKVVQFELIQEGHKVDLVESNKDKYLEKYMEKYFYAGRERELAELKLGFNTVVYPQYAEIFTPMEMMRQIKGEEVVDVKMLISKANYEGYSAESAVIRWLWSIVQTFDQEKMNTFIQFVTGSPKITVYNSNFSITIEKVYEIECLPVAHTCFNTIDLPEYSTKEILEKKLMTAIYQGNNSFGIL